MADWRGRGGPARGRATGRQRVGDVHAPAGFVIRVVGSEYGLPSRYTFAIRQGNRAPETAPATVGTNAVISETLDYTGDVDEFTVHGTPGVLVNLMLERTILSRVSVA